MKATKLKAKITELIIAFEDIINWEGNYNPVVYLNLLGELRRKVNREIKCVEKDIEIAAEYKENKKKIGYHNTPYGSLR